MENEGFLTSGAMFGVRSIVSREWVGAEGAELGCGSTSLAQRLRKV